jgi:F-type H+-transporting ATPase subunit b
VTITLIGQILTFAVLVWFIMRFLWEPVTKMLADRQKRIADGLAAAERGERAQELAQNRAKDQIRDAKQQASEIISQAQKRAGEIVDSAKEDARQEGERLLAAAQAEIGQEVHRAREQLRDQVAKLAIAGAEKILAREIDLKTHQKILDSVAKQI